MPRIVVRDDEVEQPFTVEEVNVDFNNTLQEAGSRFVNTTREYTGSFSVEQPAVDTSEMQTRMIELVSTLAKHDDNPLVTTSTINTMETNTVTMWFWKRAAEQLSDSRLEAIVNGEVYDDFAGTAAIRHEVLTRASEEIVREMERGYSPVEAFNSATSDWPLKARAWMARYENSETDHGGDTYQHDTENFAMTEGIGNYGDTEQSRLDFYGGDSPFDVDELSHEEAVTACLVAAKTTEEDVAEVVDDVLDRAEHHDTLRDWLYRSDSIDAAVRAHYYDGVLPEPITEQLAPPEEWDVLEPTDVDQSECHRCNDTYYHVRHHEVGKAWLSESGQHGMMYNVDRESGTFFNYGPSPPDQTAGSMCEACRDDWSNGTNRMSVITPDGDLLTAEFNYGLAKDCGISGDVDAVPRTEADPEYRDFFIAAIESVPSHYIEIEPNSSVAPVDEQEAALDAIAEGSAELPDVGEPVTIMKSSDLGGERYYVHFPSDDPQSGAVIKRLLEEPERVTGVSA